MNISSSLYTQKPSQNVEQLQGNVDRLSQNLYTRGIIDYGFGRDGFGTVLNQRVADKHQKAVDELTRAKQYHSPQGELLRSYNTAYNDAKSANEERYGQLLDIADKTTNQRAADITTAYDNKNAQTQQYLQRLGMANTTVAPTMETGYEREKQDALNRNADAQQQTKLGIIERRTDEYPDMGTVLGLIQAYGYSPAGV